tara:strand:+ start:7965 stop:8084 length:120 start_codon:yes stop_codon:yes gene_type:complete
LINQGFKEITKNKNVNISIIGAGISGLSCANILKKSIFK